MLLLAKLGLRRRTKVTPTKSKSSATAPFRVVSRDVVMTSRLNCGRERDEGIRERVEKIIIQF